MPTFRDLYKENIAAGDSGGVSFNDFYGKNEDEIKKRMAEEARRNKIAAAQQYAAETSAAVAGDTTNKQSIASQVKKYGPTAVKEGAISVGKTVADPFIKTANRLITIQTGGAIEAQSDRIDKALEALKSSNLSAEQKSQLEDKLLAAKNELLQGTLKKSGINQNDSAFDVGRKTAADLGQVAATVYTPGAGVLKGAAAGAGGGFLAELAKDDPTLAGAAQSTALGAALGGTVGGVSKALSKAEKVEQKIAVNTIFDEPTPPITDQSRLLPAQTASRQSEISTRLDDINTRLEEIRTGKAGTGAEVRALKKEQRALIAEQKNAERVAPVSQLDDVNQRIANAQANPKTTPEEAIALKQERDGILQNIETNSPPEIKQHAASMNAVSNTSQRVATSDDNFVPRVAQRTEARAVADKLVGPDGFDNLPIVQRMDIDQQSVAATDLARTDYETAKRIALGQEEAPPGLQPLAVHRAVEDRAMLSKDGQLMDALTKSPLMEKSAEAGQYNAVLSKVNPESPVDIMREINKIRGKSANTLESKFVTPGEAEQITTMASDVYEKKAIALANIDDEASRLAYGDARVKLDNYVENISAAAKKTSARQVIKERGLGGAAGRGIVNTGGALKSMRATFDNSAIGRQGVKVLFTNPKVWAKNSLLTFRDFAKQLGNKEMKDVLKADIISRPNSLNGMYKKMGVDVLDVTEEAYPSGLPERMWGVGRIVKASDAAYTGFVQRSRADLADQYIKIAKKSGVDLADKKQAESIGHLVNALTGRGKGWGSEGVNNVFFSPKLLKSHIDTLTAHTFQEGVTPFVRKQAAINLVKIVAGMGATLKLAEAALPGSVEWDPRSSNFGKIKVGNTRFDVTGGMASIPTLLSRFSGKSKSSITGDIKDLNSQEFGSENIWDVIEQFGENKLAPGTAFLKDVAKGTSFSGENTRTASHAAKSLFVPLSVANYDELRKDPKSANKLVATVADALGIATNTYGPRQADWRKSTSKELDQFKQSVPEQQFLEANDKFNEQYQTWLQNVEKTERYQKLSTDDRSTVRTSKQDEIKAKIFKEYRFDYKRADNRHLKGL